MTPVRPVTPCTTGLPAQDVHMSVSMYSGQTEFEVRKGSGCFGDGCYCLCSSKIGILEPDPQYDDGVWREGLWEVMRSGGHVEPPRVGEGAYKGDCGEFFHVFLHVKTQ